MDEAEDAVEITIVLTKQIVEYLQELSGRDSNFSEYLTWSIQREYTEQRVFGSPKEIEQVVSLAENLATQNKSYHTEIDTLRDQYTRLAVSQENLLTTVEQLRHTVAALLTNTKKQNLQ